MDRKNSDGGTESIYSTFYKEQLLCLKYIYLGSVFSAVTRIYTLIF